MPNSAPPSALAATIGMTMSDILARHARTLGDAVAVLDGDVVRSWRDLHDRTSRLANILAAEGVTAGDRVAILGANSANLYETMAATLRLGAIAVPVSFRLVAAEVAHVLVDSGARVAVVDPDRLPVLASARASAPALTGCVMLDDGYDDRLAAASAEYRALSVDESTPAFIMYTSGTTGRPKGAVLSHRNLLLHAYFNFLNMGVISDDRVALSGAPIFHIAGVSTFYMNLVAAMTTVISPSGGFDAAATVAVMERAAVSSCFFVPAQWDALCSVPDLAERDLSALRRITWGAAPASVGLLRRMTEAFPHAELVAVFGQTECSPVTCMLLGRDALRKVGSIGRPMLGVEVRVVDEAMHDVEPGRVGEIVYRGPTVTSGYWNRPDATAEAFEGGWFHSGDLVREDAEGFLHVVDRRKDMIISGGENIYSAEVEQTLAAHPKIADVAVIGVADPRWGETPLAVIVPAEPSDPPTALEIDVFSRLHLAAYKRPHRIELVEQLPRNASGKVLKGELRAAFAATNVVSEPAL